MRFIILMTDTWCVKRCIIIIIPQNRKYTTLRNTRRKLNHRKLGKVWAYDQQYGLSIHSVQSSELCKEKLRKVKSATDCDFFQCYLIMKAVTPWRPSRGLGPLESQAIGTCLLKLYVSPPLNYIYLQHAKSRSILVEHMGTGKHTSLTAMILQDH